MTRTLPTRGMIAGVAAGLLAFVFGRVFGEPQVQLAINFETAMDIAAGHAPDPELVSRSLQRSFGLLTAAILFGAGYGGLFSLVFTVAYGRVERFGPRSLAAPLALGGFVAVVLVPDLKYPANPPSVGEPATIGLRTAVFFEMIALSLAAMTLAVLAARRLLARLGDWNAVLAGVAVYIASLQLPSRCSRRSTRGRGTSPRPCCGSSGWPRWECRSWCGGRSVFGPPAERLLMPRVRYQLPVSAASRGRSR